VSNSVGATHFYAHEFSSELLRNRLAAAGKKPKVIIVAGMPKMITTLNAMLRDGLAWQPQSS